MDFIGQHLGSGNSRYGASIVAPGSTFFLQPGSWSPDAGGNLCNDESTGAAGSSSATTVGSQGVANRGSFVSLVIGDGGSALIPVGVKIFIRRTKLLLSGVSAAGCYGCFRRSTPLASGWAKFGERPGQCCFGTRTDPPGMRAAGVPTIRTRGLGTAQTLAISVQMEFARRCWDALSVLAQGPTDG